MMQTWPCPGKQIIWLPQHLNGEAYHLQVPQETPMSPHAYVSQQPPNQILFYSNQSVVELF